MFLSTYILFLTLPQLIYVGPNDGTYFFYGYDNNKTNIQSNIYSVSQTDLNIIGLMYTILQYDSNITYMRAFVDYGISGGPLPLDIIVGQQRNIIYGIMIIKLFSLLIVTIFTCLFLNTKLIKFFSYLAVFLLFCAFATNMISLNKSFSNMVNGKIYDVKGTIYMDISDSGDFTQKIIPIYIGKFDNYDELFDDIVKYNNPMRCYRFGTCQETNKFNLLQILYVCFVSASGCSLLIIILIILIGRYNNTENDYLIENVFSFSDD